MVFPREESLCSHSRTTATSLPHHLLVYNGSTAIKQNEKSKPEPHHGTCPPMSLKSREWRNFFLLAFSRQKRSSLLSSPLLSSSSTLTSSVSITPTLTNSIMDLLHHPPSGPLVHPPSHERVHESQLDYSHDPTRDLPSFIVHAHTPFNAEPRMPLLVNAGQITPTDLFFKRNHGPIPDIKLEHHRVYIGLQHPKASSHADWAELSMYDIMSRWPKVTVTASLQVCPTVVQIQRWFHLISWTVMAGAFS